MYFNEANAEAAFALFIDKFLVLYYTVLLRIVGSSKLETHRILNVFKNILK